MGSVIRCGGHGEKERVEFVRGNGIENTRAQGVLYE